MVTDQGLLRLAGAYGLLRGPHRLIVIARSKAAYVHASSQSRDGRATGVAASGYRDSDRCVRALAEAFVREWPSTRPKPGRKTWQSTHRPLRPVSKRRGPSRRASASPRPSSRRRDGCRPTSSRRCARPGSSTCSCRATSAAWRPTRSAPRASSRGGRRGAGRRGGGGGGGGGLGGGGATGGGGAVAVAEPARGYRVTGRWGFASGSSHADWFVGEGMVYDGDELRRDSNGHGGKRGGGGVPLNEVPRVQAAIAQATALVESASEYFYASSQRLWDEAVAGRDEAGTRARVRLATSNAAQASVQAVDIVHAAVGTAAVFAENAIERQFRDIHTAVEHGRTRRAPYRAAGRVLLGMPADFPFF